MASVANQTGAIPLSFAAAGLLRRSAPRNDNRLRCNCERGEAISVMGASVPSVRFAPLTLRAAKLSGG